jgi:hypothetical protein
MENSRGRGLGLQRATGKKLVSLLVTVTASFTSSSSLSSSLSLSLYLPLYSFRLKQKKFLKQNVQK